MRIVPQGTLVTVVLVPQGTRSGSLMALVVPKDTEVRGQSRRLGSTSTTTDRECPNLAQGHPTKPSASRNRDLIVRCNIV